MEEPHSTNAKAPCTDDRSSSTVRRRSMHSRALVLSRHQSSRRRGNLLSRNSWNRLIHGSPKSMRERLSSCRRYGHTVELPTGLEKRLRSGRADKSVGTCRMALMPLGTPAGVVSLEPVTDWATVADGGLTATRQCAGLRRTGGTVIINGE